MRRLFFAVLLLCPVLFISAFAQTTNATLGGTVSDATGALIPGVTVTATNTQTGVVTTVVTNETGAYQFASLQTGTYRVSAELPGFQKQTYNEVTLGLSQQVRLNFTLQVGGQTQTVEVTVAADTLIATTSASVGTVIPEYKVRDLPLATRNILDLLGAAPGAMGSNFAGGRLTQLNTTRDGIPVSDGRYDIGAATTTFVSPDLVEEVRVITAPADAEMGRGSGQFQMVTRSGTNQFRGSLFWTNRNSKLFANTWNNNFTGVAKDYSNGNQFGGRVGGPIIKNKTFFFFLFDGQRYVTKSYFTGPVLTREARQGIFRYFPGVQNANLISNNPTVDVAGNPVRPAAATGDLQSFSVFGRDPNRPGFDPSGWVQRLIARMPLPNDFTSCGPAFNALGGAAAAMLAPSCDGLNVAGHRWLRRIEGQDVPNGDGQDTNRNNYNVRIDHNFNSNHRATFSGTWERDWAQTAQAGISNWPGGYNGEVRRAPRVMTGSLVSTLSSSIVNEFRFGTRKNWNYSWSSIWRDDEVGAEARKQLPTKNGVPFFPVHILFGDNIITSVSGAATRGQTSPLFNYSDTVSWTQGKHAFKGGFEARFTSSRGWNGTDNPDWVIFPTVTIGAGSTQVQGISTISGLGQNTTTAQNLLLDLSGSVSNASLTYNAHSPTDTTFTPLVRIKDYHQNEWGAFFKDDWKIRPNLTLNLGVRYDYYGVPWEKSGLHAIPVGGSAGLFGISGTDISALWNPYATGGSLTRLQLVGKNSTHPDTLFYNNDWNNFGPAVGLSWSLPWWGKDKTVLRAGYGMNYQGAASFNGGLNIASGNNPGLSYVQNLTTLGLGANYYNLSTIPVPLPAPSNIKPLDVEPLNLRINPLAGFDNNRVNPYIQNFNVEIQRELARNLTFEARYIGSKGTKLYGGISLNDVNIYENGILDAFNITRAGGDAPLFDQMLRGLNLGLGAINGTTVTGSASLRTNTLTRSFIANGNVGQLANFLNTSPTATGQAGGLIKNGGFPDNFVVVNPQYAAVVLNSNPGSSTYHSMNLQVTKRLSHGFTNQFAYTWSRSLGEASTDGNLEYLNPRNHALNHTLLNFHRTHDIRSSGTLELPFGPNRKFLSGGPAFLERLVEHWQLGGIFSWISGAPLTITASNSELTWTPVPGQIAILRTSNTPVILGDFAKSVGKVTPTASGAFYFAGFTQVPDPSISGVTTRPDRAGEPGLQSQFSNRAIADASGTIILANPAPGTVGTLGRAWIEGPSHTGLDMNLLKRIRITESKEFEIRVIAVNVLNNPRWNDPITDINNLNFGRITAADTPQAQVLSNADFKSGNRRFTFSARLNF